MKVYTYGNYTSHSIDYTNSIEDEIRHSKWSLEKWFENGPEKYVLLIFDGRMETYFLTLNQYNKCLIQFEKDKIPLQVYFDLSGHF